MTADEESGVTSMAEPTAGGPQPRRRRRGLAAAVATMLLAGVAGAGYAGWREGWWERWTAGPAGSEPSASGGAPSPGSTPSASGTDRPDSVVLPTAPPATPLAGALTSAATMRPVRVRAALTADLADPALGRHVVVEVAPLAAAGPTVRFGDASLTPASTTKLLTTVAALETLGPDHVFSTTVVSGARRGDVVLVGGGDPYLMSRPLRPEEEPLAYPDRADLVELARRTAESLRAEGIRRVRLGFDSSLFTGPAFAPQWEPDYATDEVVAPITALWVDEGRPASGYGRVADPAARAALLFGRRLAAQGVRVVGAPRPAAAAADARELARVDSAPLAQIVERVLDVSDNEAAEVLAHHVGIAAGFPGSFAGGVQGVTATLEGLGVPLTGARLYDGSGLSRRDRLAPETLVAVLRLAADAEHPELRPAWTGLPVAGFSGSLSYRFEDGADPGRGEVRAKTGTLTGVSGLAGVVVDRSGTPLLFVLVADRVAVEDTLAARAALDRLAADLAACRCSS